MDSTTKKRYNPCDTYNPCSVRFQRTINIKITMSFTPKEYTMRCKACGKAKTVFVRPLDNLSVSCCGSNENMELEDGEDNP